MKKHFAPLAQLAEQLTLNYSFYEGKRCVATQYATDFGGCRDRTNFALGWEERPRGGDLFNQFFC